MKTDINSAAASKINYTALVMALIGGAVALDYIPPELEETVISLTMIVGPVLIATFRTWFTKP